MAARGRTRLMEDRTPMFYKAVRVMIRCGSAKATPQPVVKTLINLSLAIGIQTLTYSIRVTVMRP